MTGKRWLQEHEPQWQRLEQILGRAHLGTFALPPTEVRELGLLYRNLINDLARAQSQPELRHLEPYLNNLAQRCHALVYEHPPTRWGNVSL